MPRTRPCCVFSPTGEGRNYAVTRLVAEIAENYYGLFGCSTNGLRIWITSSPFQEDMSEEGPGRDGKEAA